MSFSLTSYQRMLARGLEVGYSFIRFQELVRDRFHGDHGHRCLIRHDVDADLSAAVAMAQVERGLGVSATYFLMLRSPLYNLMGRQNHLYAGQLLTLGHEIGLHYDQGFDAKRGWTPEQTAEAVDLEARWLERQFGTRVSAVSFHQPGPAVLQGQIATGSRINTYDRVRLSSFDYFSDSNRVFPLSQEGVNGVGESLAAYAPRSLQLLIHPIWWVYEDETTDAAWNRAIEANLQAMQRQLIETERAYGSARRFAIEQL